MNLKKITSAIAWPLLFSLCVCVTQYGFYVDKPVIFFNVAYILLIISLLCLERIIPHEKEWNQDDGQTFANIAHTLMSKGTVQGIVIFSTSMGLAGLITPVGDTGYGFWPDLWPREWPMAVQIIGGVIIAEFGLYWAHRLAHEFMPLWYFHSIHHSVIRLWIVNTGRFHFLDSVFSIVLAMAILFALGAPMEVMVWLSAITAFIGMLTHCNVEMRFGPLSWVFNTPGLHRWHHSRDIREGNKNYGENLMIWDQIFRTYFNPDRRPPANIGVNEYIPPGFVAQLVHPFAKLKTRLIGK